MAIMLPAKAMGIVFSYQQQVYAGKFRYIVQVLMVTTGLVRLVRAFQTSHAICSSV